MQKILFIMPMYSLSVDNSMGGAVEMLKKILIDENEKNRDFEFYFISPYNIKDTYKLTKVIFVNKKNIVDNIRRIFYFPLRKLKIIDEYTSSYYKKAFKIAKKIQPDKIVFSNSYTKNINRFTKEFGKEKLYYHIHHRIEKKEDISKYFGNLISVSKYIEDDWKNSKVLKNNINFYILKNCLFTKNFVGDKVDDFSNNKTEQIKLKNNLEFDKDDFIVLYCGRIKKDKGVGTLIDAFSKIDNPKIKLLIIGGANFLDSKNNDKFVNEILKKVKPFGNRVKLLGYIPNNELFKYYLISNLHIIPTLCEEAAGIVALESKALGINQIISDSGGLKEFANQKAIVIERNSSFVDNLSSSILKMFNQNDKQSIPEIIYDDIYYYKEFKKIMEKI